MYLVPTLNSDDSSSDEEASDRKKRRIEAQSKTYEELDKFSLLPQYSNIAKTMKKTSPKDKEKNSQKKEDETTTTKISETKSPMDQDSDEIQEKFCFEGLEFLMPEKVQKKPEISKNPEVIDLDKEENTTKPNKKPTISFKSSKTKLNSPNFDTKSSSKPNSQHASTPKPPNSQNQEDDLVLPENADQLLQILTSSPPPTITTTNSASNKKISPPNPTMMGRITLNRNELSKSSQSGTVQAVPAAKNLIFAHFRQENNPILRFMSKKFTIEFRKDITPDYTISESICVIFISLRFFVKNPNYLMERITSLKNMFLLRVILCSMDISDDLECEEPMEKLNKMAFLGNCSLIVAFSKEECAQYLEFLKSNEHKSANEIKTKVEDTQAAKVQHALSAISYVNKTNVLNLRANLESVRAIFNVSNEVLSKIPGFGTKKVKNFIEVMHAPFQIPKNDDAKKDKKKLKAEETHSNEKMDLEIKEKAQKPEKIEEKTEKIEEKSEKNEEKSEKSEKNEEKTEKFEEKSQKNEEKSEKIEEKVEKIEEDPA